MHGTARCEQITHGKSNFIDLYVWVQVPMFILLLHTGGGGGGGGGRAEAEYGQGVRPIYAQRWTTTGSLTTNTGRNDPKSTQETQKTTKNRKWYLVRVTRSNSAFYTMKQKLPYVPL